MLAILAVQYESLYVRPSRAFTLSLYTYCTRTMKYSTRVVVHYLLYLYSTCTVEYLIVQVEPLHVRTRTMKYVVHYLIVQFFFTQMLLLYSNHCRSDSLKKECVYKVVLKVATSTTYY
jgi:hypothetical protein